MYSSRGVGNERNLVHLVEKSVEIMTNQSRFPWNQARKSAQPSSPTHFYNYDVIFEGNHGEIKEKSDDSSSPEDLQVKGTLLHFLMERTIKVDSLCLCNSFPYSIPANNKLLPTVCTVNLRTVVNLFTLNFCNAW